jgi:hypothetical protein
VLRETDDLNDVSGQSYDEWQLDMWVDFPNIRPLSAAFLPILFQDPAEYRELNQNDKSREALHLEYARHENELPCAPTPQKAVLFCPPQDQLHHVEWWVMKCFTDNVHRFHMYAEMGNDDHTEMQLKYQALRNPSVFITTPIVGWTGQNHTAAIHAVVTQ